MRDGWRMSKFTNIFLVAFISSTDTIMARAVSMTPQIQSLLDEKQQKIEQLEKCEGKKQGWMIAGISTIGLTAVGVVGNVVLANKSKNIDSAINSEKSLLNDAQQELNEINDKIIAEKQNDVDTKDSQDTKKDYTVKFTAEKYGTQKPIVTGNSVQNKKSNYDAFNLKINGTGYCFRSVRDDRYRGNITIDECRTLDYSDWLVLFPDEKIVRGISVISRNMPSSREKGVVPDAKNQDSLMNEYNDWRNNGRPLPVQDAEYACYCKMTEPYIGDWVFESWASGYALTDNCAFSCAWAIEDIEKFRNIVFGK